MNTHTNFTTPIRKTKAPELKKDKMVHVLLTSKQAEQLTMKAEQSGVSVSSYIRLKLKLK
jgi:predicted DNA binding CopG/RHH family protein